MLAAITIRNRLTGEERMIETGFLFLCLGGVPNTEWANEVGIVRDEEGYLVTGPDLATFGCWPTTWKVNRDPYYLETSMPGVFAAGDVTSRLDKAPDVRRRRGRHGHRLRASLFGLGIDFSPGEDQSMHLKQELADERRRLDLLNFYGKFEQIVIFILTMLIAVFVIFAVWNLALKVVQSIASSTLDPTDYSVFQTVFGAILTVIIALEFKKSFAVSAERQQSVVEVRTVILIALLAVVRKVLDPRSGTRNDRVVCAGGSHHRAWSGLLAC